MKLPLLLLLALIGLATAITYNAGNKITFINQDSQKRTIHFTPSVPLPQIPQLHLTGHQTKTINIPDGWTGMWFSVTDGQPWKIGVLGEVHFGSDWYKLTFFDVSAIDNPADYDGVKQIWPKKSRSPFSGCEDYHTQCDNAYYLPDDIQTKATDEVHLVCTVGNGRSPLSSSKREQKPFEGPPSPEKSGKPIPGTYPNGILITPENFDEAQIDWENGFDWDAIDWESVNWDQLDFSEGKISYFRWLYFDAPRKAEGGEKKWTDGLATTPDIKRSVEKREGWPRGFVTGEYLFDKE
ncbi:hypothetical protein QBC35DRAFT_133736 [Podospora australis]|uniref:Uncharacterized protein n=1 Tax=Podospora australis TaxID=1536484 RepID=A0AAN7AI95_9PEZI|nr:hypothetical protein QBC35DRAFT_133736 [Podospora australis]